MSDIEKEILDKSGQVKDEFVDLMEDKGPECSILCKVLNTKSMMILNSSSIDGSFFVKYRPLYDFITEHISKYGQVPDISTIAIEFPDFSIFDVQESDQYLVDRMYEQHLFRLSCITLKKLEPLLQEDSQKAVEFLQQEIPKLANITPLNSFDLVEKSPIRLQEYENMLDREEEYFINTGFHEFDSIMGGFKKEDLVILLARPNQGKSWIVDKFALEAWKQGKRVGIYSGEMSKTDVGYRLDTLDSHISNTCLQRGNKAVHGAYKDYIDFLQKQQNPIFVTTQKDFNGRPTTAKLQAFIEKEKLDILFVDQLYSVQPTTKSRDRRLQFEEIMQESLDITMRLGVPIVYTCQANRKVVGEEAEKDKLPRIEHIAESDSIGQIATRVISMCQYEGNLLLKMAKNRNLALGDKVAYLWNIDKGLFEYNPDGINSNTDDEGPRKVPASRRRGGMKRPGSEVF
jgi:replicative DNA helicase